MSAFEMDGYMENANERCRYSGMVYASSPFVDIRAAGEMPTGSWWYYGVDERGLGDRVMFFGVPADFVGNLWNCPGSGAISTSSFYTPDEVLSRDELLDRAEWIAPGFCDVWEW